MVRLVSYLTVRSEIRTFKMQEDQQHFECSNPFQNRIPNLVIIALVASTAVNETVTQDPFAFQKFGLSSIKQLVTGEEYPEILEMTRDNDSKGYFRFLQPAGQGKSGQKQRKYGQKSRLGSRKKLYPICI